jgi:glycerol-3-phosphate dehydrogenase
MVKQPPALVCDRAATIADLEASSLDVLVIGGGIVGAGVARDAAMRGLRTGLVEQRDYASGTSSRSSRLLHGGIRYLAQGRLGLVQEASKEKTVIARIAPHLADPLPFLFPTRRRSSWSRWKLSIGVKLYDLLCGRKNFGRSSSLGVDETLRLLPGLSRNRLTGAVRYYDALTNDARLVLDTLRSAASHGAMICNYVALVNADPDGDAWRSQLRDAETGRELVARARTVVNATGPWSDRLPHSKTSLRVTKGVHLVVDSARFPAPEAVVMGEGSRLVFAIPWGERVILGTTDTDYHGDLAEPPCEVEDVDYVLGVVNDAFPDANLDASDVVSTWAGLRPLVADPHGNPSDISRRHEITMGEPGWWDVTGGKLTTYRLMAEETVDAIVNYLGADVGPCATAKEPLLDPGAAKPTSGVLPPPFGVEAVSRSCCEEWVCRLEDVMIRRTSWRHYHRDHLEKAAEVADWVAAALGWSEGEKQSQVDAYRRLCPPGALPGQSSNAGNSPPPTGTSADNPGDSASK